MQQLTKIKGADSMTRNNEVFERLYAQARNASVGEGIWKEKGVMADGEREIVGKPKW